MTIYYSASARGFFDDDLHGLTMPADAVAISPARHRELIDAQAEGAEIVASSGGRPRIRRRLVAPAENRALLVRRIKREAKRRILAIAPIWRQLNDLHEIETPAARTRRRQIDIIRRASDALEEAAAKMAVTELARFDPSDDAHWPGQD